MIEKRRSTHPGLGRVRDPAHSQEQAHHPLRRREDHQPRKPEARGEYLKKGHIWCFKLNRLYVRDAGVGGNIARYINHSCTPNCYTQVIGDTIWIRAARNIRKGEELTYDYSTDGEGSIPCRCQSGDAGHAVMRVLYLHGFASSARSSKAAFFASSWQPRHRARDTGLQRAGFQHADDHADGRSGRASHRRASRRSRGLDRFEPRRVRRGARRHAMARSWHRIVLLAPALDFGGNRMRSLGDRGLEEWRRPNRLDVFHHGYGRVMPVHYEPHADATRYDAMNARVEIPVQIFQGSRDDAVDPGPSSAGRAAAPARRAAPAGRRPSAARQPGRSARGCPDRRRDAGASRATRRPPAEAFLERLRGTWRPTSPLRSSRSRWPACRLLTFAPDPAL